MKHLFILFSLVGSHQIMSQAFKEQDNHNRPNVLVILIDDLGFSDPSFQGNPLIKTPNIDRLADMGLVISNFYANSPVCSPSRAALITGQYPGRFGINSYIADSKSNENRNTKNFLDPNVPTLPKTLQSEGYATAHFGKWHLGGGRDISNAPLPTEYGFDKSLVCFEGLGDRLLISGHNLSEQSQELGNGKITYTTKDQMTKILVDSSLTFITKNRENSFYLELFPADVHDPYLPQNKNIKPFVTITKNPHEQKFLAVLSNLDIQIGRLLDGLESLGRLENTIIIFTSDNGPSDLSTYYDQSEVPEGVKAYPPGFSFPFRGRKWSIYEGGIRMPFIISWPNHIKAGSHDSISQVAAIDLYPSICSLLKIESPFNLDGMDRSNVFLGESSDRKYPIYWQFNATSENRTLPGNPYNIAPDLAARHENWKLLMNEDFSSIELYDITKDSAESFNLVEYYPEIAENIAIGLLKWSKAIHNERVSRSHELEFFPNPAINILKIPLIQFYQPQLQIKITDMCGKETSIRGENSGQLDGIVELDISNLSMGAYLININDGAHHFSSVFIKK